jgi:hypothetical protein
MKIRFRQRMDCYYWFYVRQKKLSKALLYVNKALAIDNQNRCTGNVTSIKKIDLFEEADSVIEKQ